MAYKEVEPKIGDRYGHLKVVSVGRPGKTGAARYWCRCDCGNRKLVYASALKRGMAKSCGHEKKGKTAFKKIQGFKCIETGEVFATSNEAAEYAGIPGQWWSIVFAASKNPTVPHAGFNPETGERLHWCRAEALKEIPYKPGRAIHSIDTSKRNAVKFVLLNTNTLYEGIGETAKLFHIKTETLRKCLRGEREWAGKDQEGNRLYWMYYDDWKKVFRGRRSDDE